MTKPNDQSNLEEFMDLYAQKGVEYWTGLPDPVKLRAKHCLGQDGIAENEDDIYISVRHGVSKYNPDLVKFIPIPGPVKNVDLALFRPVREQVDKKPLRSTFYLFLMVTQKEQELRPEENDDATAPPLAPKQEKCLSFRWEQAESASETHGYAHIQLCRNILKKDKFHHSIPPWLPDSYPAIPIGSADPLDMFLSLTTSVHGIHAEGEKKPAGIGTILEEVYKNNTRKALQLTNMAKSIVGHHSK